MTSILPPWLLTQTVRISTTVSSTIDPWTKSRTKSPSFAAHIDAATYRLLRAIAEFDRREAWGWGFQSTAHWLTWRVGIDMVTAREKVRVARALEGLPQISDTFRQGKVSYSKVRAMTRIATPENEGYLLYIAENGTASDVESLVRAYRRASRGEDVEEARRHREERYLDMYTDEDGMVVIRGRLPQEVAALLEKALDAAMDSLREEEKRENDDSAESSDDPASMDAGGLPRRLRSSQCPRLEEACGSVHDDSAESLDRGTPTRGRGIPAGACPRNLQAGAGMTDGVHDSAESLRGSTTTESQGIPACAGMTDGDFAQRRVDALGLLAEAALGRGLGQDGARGAVSGHDSRRFGSSCRSIR